MTSANALFIALATTFLISISGCSSETIKVPEKVYVPVKCKVDKTTPPYDTGDPVLNNTHILIYTQIIKGDLDFCVDGEIPKE